ncbi:MAG: helix-turn-helix domain-containing protein [Bacteroides sp.]|nr:helix-turn-helix domain-containing protein [Bacteroides sp.]
MRKKEEKNSIIEICPIRNVVARFGNKWALLIILVLSENGKTRFNQLGKLIPDISTKVLSNTLQVLEADELVKRTVFPEVPIRVEYELTPTGQSLVPIIASLTEWAQQNMKSIMKHRKLTEQRVMASHV